MRISQTIFVATALLSTVHICAAQTTASTPAGSAAATGTTFKLSAPSEILRRSLDEVQQTVESVRLDKWKKGTVRGEAESNINAIQRDLQGTLPSLLKDADSNPGSLSKVLPLSRNVDALYDVLVHVVEAARVIGTSDQVGQLQQAMADLEKARLALDNQMQQTADAQERQIVELRSTVQKQEASLRAAATTPTAAKCPAPTPAKKKKPAAKPSASTTNVKPAAAAPANQQPKTQ
jgi:hypothetical protein